MATPTRAKKRLGRFLGELRTANGRSLIDAATELKTSDSTVSRYESGEVKPVWATVQLLLHYYEASKKDEDRAAQLWQDTQVDPPPLRLPKGAPKEFRQYLNAERDASFLHMIELSVIPGLLQTERYIRAAIDAAHRLTRRQPDTEAIVSTRLMRQERLANRDDWTLHAIIDEAVIRHVVGGADVMADQLNHLIEIGRRPHVAIQVMPFSAGAPPVAGPFILIGTDEPGDLPGAYFEHPAGGAWIENAEDVAYFTARFDGAAKLALSARSSATLIRQQVKVLQGNE